MFVDNGPEFFEQCDKHFSDAADLLLTKARTRQDAEMMVSRYFGYVWPGELKQNFSEEMAAKLKVMVDELQSQGFVTREKDPGMEILILRWTDKFRWGETLSSHDRKKFKEESREVGNAANEKGGIARMREVFYSVPDKSMRVLIEDSWDGIGDWRS